MVLFQIVCVFTFIASVVFTIVCICNHIDAHKEQISNLESINYNRQLIEIYKRQAEEFIAEFKLYLGEKYPEHEKEIFKLISANKGDRLIDVVMSLPEIHTSETLTKLVAKVCEYRRNVYDTEDYIIQNKRDMRVRKRNPFLVTRFLPMYEDF